jgi:hypothetical protein
MRQKSTGKGKQKRTRKRSDVSDAKEEEEEEDYDKSISSAAYVTCRSAVRFQVSMNYGRIYPVNRIPRPARTAPHSLQAHHFLHN